MVPELCLKPIHGSGTNIQGIQFVRLPLSCQCVLLLLNRYYNYAYNTTEPNMWLYSAGLVNGALGTVIDFIYEPNTSPPEDLPIAVMVRFDRYTGPTMTAETVPVKPITRYWTKGTKTHSREQLPLMPAWGWTVHQAQGQTYDKVCLVLH